MKELFNFMDEVKGTYFKDIMKAFGKAWLIIFALECFSIYNRGISIMDYDYMCLWLILIGMCIIGIINKNRNQVIRKNGTFTRLMLLPSKYKMKMKIRYMYSEFLFCLIGFLMWVSIWLISDCLLLIISTQFVEYETNTLFYMILQNYGLNYMIIYHLLDPVKLIIMMFIILHISSLCTISSSVGIADHWLAFTIPFIAVSFIVLLLVHNSILCLAYSVIAFILSSVLVRYVYWHSDLK